MTNVSWAIKTHLSFYICVMDAHINNTSNADDLNMHTLIDINMNNLANFQQALHSWRTLYTIIVFQHRSSHYKDGDTLVEEICNRTCKSGISLESLIKLVIETMITIEYFSGAFSLQHPYQ